MGILKKKIGLLFIFLPFVLANKECQRSITWGDVDSNWVSPWEGDHKDIDKDTTCVDCHDDIRSPQSRPATHDLSWIRKHGDYGPRKYGYKTQNMCYFCHKEGDCAQCHLQEAPLNHTGFWRLKGHAVSTSLDRSRCATCHASVDFCERCHAETKPMNHLAAWGTPRSNHCLSCHFPLTSVGAQTCAVCHTGTPSHQATPSQPNNALHLVGADCRSCHAPLRHQDNGMACTSCHTK